MLPSPIDPLPILWTTEGLSEGGLKAYLLGLLYPFWSPEAIFTANSEKSTLPFALGTTISIRPMLSHSRRGLCQKRPRPKINLVRRPVSQRLVRPFDVVKTEIIGTMCPRRRDSLVIVNINLIVFDRPPESFDKDVVVNPAAAENAQPRKNLLPKIEPDNQQQLLHPEEGEALCDLGVVAADVGTACVSDGAI